MILFKVLVALVLISCFASGMAQSGDSQSSHEEKFWVSLRSPRLKLLWDFFSDPIPETFDAREAWPKCKIIQWIRNQWDCHCACFVFAVVSMIADRVCIASDGINQTELSAYDAMVCCGEQCVFRTHEWHDYYGQCIDIQYFTKPIQLFKEFGLSSGGDYNTTREKGCLPITSRRIEFNKCPTHCAGSNSSTVKSQRTTFGWLVDGEQLLIEKIETFMIEMVQRQIMKHGPCAAVLFVDDQFRNYKEGVYQGVTKPNLSDVAAVKILGWGLENGVPYWLAANSLGTDWGDKGFLKIVRDTEVVRFFAAVRLYSPEISTTGKPYTKKPPKKVESEWMTDEEDQEGDDENNSEALENYTVLVVVTFLLIFLLG